jgi:putative FmdB family regulatory protein
MPIYEYVCEKCGSRTEVLQKVSDPPLKRCQKCRGKLEKTVSRTSFQLKGGGWYATDYSRKSSSSQGPEKTEKGGDKKSESEKKTDSAKKTESAPSSK